MKNKLSISIEESLLKLIDQLVISGRFRNKSHLVEYSVNKVVEESLERGGE